MIVAVTVPVVENWRFPPKDSFPLSYYPMFTTYRRTTSVTYLVGIDGDGGRRTLTYSYAFGGGLNQARRQINRMVERGRAAELCAIVARNVGVSRRRSLGAVVAVEIRTERFRLREYLTTRERTPVSERVHYTCAVERPQQ